MTASAHCPSCGAAFISAWCAHCGERRLRPELLGLRHYAREAWGALTDVDGRLLGSIWTLMRRPGALTRAWWIGRRRPFMSPIQVFLLASVAFFLLSPFDLFSTPLRFHLQVEFLPHRDLARELVQRRIAPELDSETFLREVAPARRDPVVAAVDPGEARTSAASDRYRAFEREFDRLTPILARSLVFVMIPMLALASWLATLVLRGPSAPTLHLVHATHFLAALQVISLMVGVLLPPALGRWALQQAGLDTAAALDLAYSLLFLAILLVYQFFAARRLFVFGLARAALFAGVASAALIWTWGAYRALLFLVVFHTVKSIQMRAPISPMLLLHLLFSGSAAIAAEARISEWPLPTAVGAAQPQLLAKGPHLYLSWIEPSGEAHRMLYARADGHGFAPAREIARGTRWFVNWADVPSFTVLDDGSMAAYVLQKSGDATYAYDVLLTRSRDGVEWSAPQRVHDDGTQTEHGFASLWPWSGHELAIAWLDGRLAGAGGHAGHGGGGGAMTLRAAIFGPEGKRIEWELDERTCDCCPTDVAHSSGGPVLVYRDRDVGEIRDIAITRWRDGEWTPPRRVHADDWRMPGCPVNGPAIAAQARDVYVAWYTMQRDEPVLRLAHSRDDGAGFATPISLMRGAELLGRVDLALDAGWLYALWLSEDANAQSLWLARLPRDLAAPVQPLRVATLARGRGTGLPRLGVRRGEAFVVWTDILDKSPILRGARVAFRR